MNIKEKIYNEVLWLMPKSLAHKILYYKMSGKKLNLKNPKTIDDKLHYLMVYKYREKYGKLADKYEVRKFIKERNYEELLPKLYGVYNNANEIDFNKLPNKFVLKTNHGCGNVFICTDKEKFNFEEAKDVLNKALKKNFARKTLEYHYSYIEPKIICEEYLDDKEHKLPLDYKFYCFDGHVECLLLCSDRENGTKLDYYDLNWNKLPYSIDKYTSHKEINKPKTLDEMIKVASDLSKGFEFVRVDLYDINGKVYFGEMTFTPVAGYIYENTQESLEYLGSLINEKNVRKE